MTSEDSEIDRPDESVTSRHDEAETDRRAVVLLSGGIDSTTTAAVARADGYALYALTIDYGQRHAVELGAARASAERLGVERYIVQKMDLRAFGGSALTDDIDVPTGRVAPESGDRSDQILEQLSDQTSDQTSGQLPDQVPVTYVPARNTIFLALALAFAESVGAYDIFIGANAVDYSGYPDCRPAFIAKFEELANLATAAAVEGRGRFSIHAPLIDMTKAEIIRTGVSLGIDYADTHSCYDPSAAGLACGRCDSCVIRAKGFLDASIPDPTRYALQ